MAFRVFVSSTWRDLEAEREAVEAMLHRMRDAEFAGMEYFGSRPDTPRDVCMAQVEASDVYVGIFAHRYGSLDPKTGLSMTELEYRHACEQDIPCLIYIKSDDVPVLPRHMESDLEKLQKLLALKADLKAAHELTFFKSPGDLAACVSTDLHNRLAKEKPKGSRPKSPALAKGELHRTTQRYLQFVVDRYRYLEFKGMGVSDRVPLRLPLTAMYVPLKARVELPEGETRARDLRVAGRLLAKEGEAAIGERLSELKPVLELLQGHDGLIVLGDPGAGKTTFLKYLAVQLASGQHEALGLGPRLPVLVPISAYATALVEGDLRLDRFICDYYAERCTDLPIAQMLEEALREGRALILLDGLDEVRELSRRHVVVEGVIDFYTAHRPAGNKFALTSRIIGYREVRPVVEGLIECTLDDFDDEEIEQFVERWTTGLESAARGDTAVAREEAERERGELLAAIQSNPGVRRLAANPLLLTILALMKRRGVTLPERRAELYDHYVRTLLSSWNRARGLGRPPSRDLDVVEMLRILAPLALWMHRSSPGVGLVQRGDLLRKLEEIYAQRGEPDAEVAALQFLSDVREFAGILLERGPGLYGFIHLTFEEYLAAVGIARLGQRDSAPIVDTLAAHVGDPAWREVALLTIGYLGIVQQWEEVASDVVNALLSRRSGAPGEAAVLAGQAVVDAGSGGVTRECRQRTVAATLAAMRAGEVEPSLRAAAGRALAHLGDPRQEITTLEQMAFCYVPAGTFLMGSPDEDEMAYDDEKPLHCVDIPYGYWMGRYPVTNAQFRTFAQDPQGYGDDRWWTAAGLSWRGDRQEPEDPGEPWNLPSYPVVAVTWYEVVAFSAWLTARWREQGFLGEDWAARLPTEAEWEKAARGGERLSEKSIIRPVEEKLRAVGGISGEQNKNVQRRYPWGNDPDPARANYTDTGIGETSAVGCFPAGVSPYGVQEMSGNVWEWTRSLWGEDWGQPEFKYPYDPQDGRENLEAGRVVMRVLRGGSFYIDGKLVRCAYRRRSDPYLLSLRLLFGVRVVVAPATRG